MGMTLEQAVAFAALCHEGQKDKVGDTYILHPLRVMGRLRTLAERRVAVLHDVVEDCGVTLWQLRKLGIPAREVRAIDALTRRQGEPYLAFVARAGEDALARRVKLADLADNMDEGRLAKLPAERREALQAKYGGALALLGRRHG
jgi:(p)ppGpp synthase/HD superfamily hydrolase